tara:strand:- start:404 stop:616 length:213 start_codon:yes stop_codon:yes gene_type:complete
MITDKKLQTYVIENNVPFKMLIKRNGYYFIHSKTITEMGGIQRFKLLMNAYNLKLSSEDKLLNIFKITKI